MTPSSVRGRSPATRGRRLSWRPTLDQLPPRPLSDDQPIVFQTCWIGTTHCPYGPRTGPGLQQAAEDRTAVPGIFRHGYVPQDRQNQADCHRSFPHRLLPDPGPDGTGHPHRGPGRGGPWTRSSLVVTPRASRACEPPAVPRRRCRVGAAWSSGPPPVCARFVAGCPGGPGSACARSQSGSAGARSDSCPASGASGVSRSSRQRSGAFRNCGNPSPGVKKVGRPGPEPNFPHACH